MLRAYYEYDKLVQPRSRKSRSYTSVARAKCHGGRSGGFAVTCSSRGWCCVSFTSHGRCAPSPHAPQALPVARVWLVEVSGSTNSAGAIVQLPMASARAGDGHDLPRGACTSWARWAGETHRPVLPRKHRGLPAGGDRGDTPSRDVSKRPFYIIKKSRSPAGFSSSTKEPPGTTLARPSPAQPAHLAREPCLGHPPTPGPFCASLPIDLTPNHEHAETSNHVLARMQEEKKKSPWQQRRQLANGSCCTHTQN